LVKPKISARPTWSSQKFPPDQLGQAKNFRQTNLVKPNIFNNKTSYKRPTWSSQGFPPDQLGQAKNFRQTNLVKPNISARPTWSSQKFPKFPSDHRGQVKNYRQIKFVKPKKLRPDQIGQAKQLNQHRTPTWPIRILQKQISFYPEINPSCTMLPRCELGTSSL
jgi:hypothetical protein